MPLHGAYGDSIRKSFRLSDAPAITTEMRPGASVAITRVQCGDEGLGKTEPLPPERALLVPVLLKPLVHELWYAGKSERVSPWPAGALSVVDMEREPTAFFGSALDAIQFYLPRSSLAAIAEQTDTRPIHDLVIPNGTVDNVTYQLGLLLVPAFAHPESVNQLFLSGLMLAFYGHLAHTYGQVLARERGDVGMAAWQLSRAKEVIAENLSGRISMTHVAYECGMSPSHFSRAFKRAIGMPPHRWLLQRRVQVAKVLLLQVHMSVADVAVASGFSDQSHLVRVFRRAEGVSPQAWRLRQLGKYIRPETVLT